MTEKNVIRVVVLISGNGTNLQALIDQSTDGSLPIKIVAVICNNPDAFGITRAENAEIPCEVIDNTDFSDRNTFDQTLQNAIDAYQPDLVVLAGYMRILSDEFVNHYLGRLLNIHPSLLPKYRGLNTHQRVLDNQEKFHGVSVHFVTPELDGGPVILQSKIEIKPDDTTESLARRVKIQEHIIYPIVVSWFALKRLSFMNNKVKYDNRSLDEPIQYDETILHSNE